MCDRNTKFAIDGVLFSLNRRQIKTSDVRAGNTIRLRIQNPNSTLPAQVKRKKSPCKIDVNNQIDGYYKYF